MKTMLGALAIAILATGVFATPAQARCWWNGYRWVCTHHYPWWWHRHPGWRYNQWCYYHPYRCR